MCVSFSGPELWEPHWMFQRYHLATKRHRGLNKFLCARMLFLSVFLPLFFPVWFMIYFSLNFYLFSYKKTFYYLDVWKILLWNLIASFSYIFIMVGSTKKSQLCFWKWSCTTIFSLIWTFIRYQILTYCMVHFQSNFLMFWYQAKTSLLCLCIS